MGKKQLNQEKSFNYLNNHLLQFGATIKDGEKYISSTTKLTILNKFNIEKTVEPYVIKRLKPNNKYWTFDGLDSDKQKKEYDKLKLLVKSKGGKIKEGEVYINSKTKMTFIDEDGFEFITTPNDIIKGRWNNGKGISEEICRQCIEFIFKKLFLSDWSVVKVNSNIKNNLQLDGYSKELKIAFEYQGQQHYSYKYMIAKNNIEKYKAFKKQKDRDFFKEQFCKNKGIKLLQIKYFNTALKNDIDYLKHVIQEIFKNKINIECYLNNLDINKFKIKNINLKNKKINELRKIVTFKGGQIKKGQVYTGTHKPMIFIDENNNEFETTPSIIFRGCWSAYSVNKIRDASYHINQIENVIKIFGAKIKDKNSYKGKESLITLINKYGIEKNYKSYYIKKMNIRSPFWEEKGNEKQQKTEILNKILNKNGAKVKEGQLHVHNKKPIIIINKNGLEIEMIPKNIIRMSDHHPFLDDDGITSEAQKNLNEILSEYNAKIKDGEKYINNISYLSVVNKHNQELKLTPKSIKSLSNKYKLWLMK